MQLILAILLFPLLSFAQVGLDRPTKPGDYRSGFYAMDATGLGASDYTAWFTPGDDFASVSVGTKADGTATSALADASAKDTWGQMEFCTRLRLRLYHLAELSWENKDVGDKYRVFYTTALTPGLSDEAQKCGTTAIRYLGDRFSKACAALEETEKDLCAGFFKDERMDAVVFGWEADAN